jgi:hypothetical protein
MPRRRQARGDRSQNNANTTQSPSLQDQSYPGTASAPINSDQVEQIRQGELYGYYEYEYEDRVNIYQLVDSWRSYRNDTLNLQSSLTPQSYQPLGSSNANGANSVQSGLNIHAPTFTPYQPLRSVHNYARYPTYRVDKPCRVSNGTRERQILHQALQASQTTAPRYPLRNRQSDQTSSHFGGAAANTPRFPDQPARSNRYENYSSGFSSADQPIPSIEKGFVPLGASTTLVPSSLPPRFADRRSYSRTPDNVVPPTRPKATGKYLKNAGKAPEPIDSPKKLLVILDLNGTLLVRPNSRGNPKSFKLRPGVTHLLDYLFTNHVVMVYSSARPENVTVIVNKLFHPTQRAQLAGIWARDKLDLNKVQYYAKVQVYKKLDKIWADPTIQASAQSGQKWNQTNTVLVDDSHLKALAQPHNLVQVTEFENNAPMEGGEALRSWQLQEVAILKSLEQKLEELKWQVDVSRLIREWQTGKQQAPGVVDETIDQKTHETVQEQSPRDISSTPSLNNAETTQPAQLSYPSPQSPGSSPSMDHGSKITTESSSALDILEAEISRGLKDTHLSDSSDRRSESPIDETVFAELLGGRRGNESLKDKESARRSSMDVPPTPESLRGS